MNWKLLRLCPALDRRASVVNATPDGGQLLDIGCSDCSTLKHFLELRPDLHYSAVDLHDFSANAPSGVIFRKVNVITENLPFDSESFDLITMMHLMEHLAENGKMPGEVIRLLKPGGRLYIEGPGSRSLRFPRGRQGLTFNFYDDPTHVAYLTHQRIISTFEAVGLRPVKTGIARSLPLIMGIPLSIVRFDSHRLLAGIMHLFGWSIFVELEKKEA